MPMEKKIIIVCEGKNDVSYLNALQRFVENDIPLPPGQLDPFLRFVPFPELEGTCTGQYDKIVAAYNSATEIFAPTPVEIWVDAELGNDLSMVKNAVQKIKDARNQSRANSRLTEESANP